MNNKGTHSPKEKVEMVKSFVFLKKELLKFTNIYKSKILLKLIILNKN